RAALAAVYLALVCIALQSGEPAPASLRIGMAQTFFRGTTPAQAKALTETLALVTDSQTHLRSRYFAAGTPYNLGEMLSDGRAQFGVFHGVEFAWTQQKYRELRPLILLINHDRHVQAWVIVRDTPKISGFAALRGKVLAPPDPACLHCQLF